MDTSCDPSVVDGLVMLKETLAPCLSSKICLARSSKRGGRGLFAKERIAKGEVVWRDASHSKTYTIAEVMAFPEEARRVFLHFSYCAGEGVLRSFKELDDVPVESWPSLQPTDDSAYMNHSCDPTAWYAFPDYKMTDECSLMVARRDIEPGEEITFDYATSEAYPEWQGLECSCGSGVCRGFLRWDDMKLPELQERYAGHVLKHVARMIARSHLSAVHHYTIEDSENYGRFISTTKTIPNEALVMVVPPNLLLKFDEMPVFNQGLQVSELLWSCSLSDEDMDNFLNHSCDPTCRAVIREDYTVLLYARREIAPGESITVDYEQFEMDLVNQGVDFMCECGAATCRGHIIGAKYHKVAPSVETTGAVDGGASAWKPGMLWAGLPAEASAVSATAST